MMHRLGKGLSAGLALFCFALALAGAPHFNAFAQDQAAAKAQLSALEQRRLAALAAPDAAALQAVLADDYIHVHGTGRVEDRAAFIKGVQAGPRVSERGALLTRVYGDTAVVTGEQTNQSKNADGAPAPPVRYFATQVAHREKSVWRLVSMQVTPIGPLPTASSPVTGYPPAKAARLTKDQELITALEAKRGAAIAASDFAALADVLADEYLHVYGGGNTSDRAGYIEQVKAAPRVPLRGPLTIRVYGDVAVVTGSLLNRIKYTDREQVLDTSVTQVVRKLNGQWKFVSFQITPKTGQ